MAVERDKSPREGILLRMSTRDSVPLIITIYYYYSGASTPVCRGSV